MTSYVRFMCLMCKNLVKKVVAWNKCEYFGFFRIKPFQEAFPISFQPTYAPLYLHPKTCMHLIVGLHNIMVSIWW